MINELSIQEVLEGFSSGKFTCKELVKQTIDTYESDKNSEIPLNAFLEMYDDSLSLAEKADELYQKARDEGEESLKKLLQEKLERWEYLESINQKIIEYKENKYDK